MTFEFAETVAADYWNQRMVHVPCHPAQRLLTDAEMTLIDARDGLTADMRASRTTCTILVSPLAEWYRTHHEYAWMYCADVVHEIGHEAGLEHSYGGVMDDTQNIVPWGCDHPRKFRRYWANRSILTPLS